MNENAVSRLFVYYTEDDVHGDYTTPIGKKGEERSNSQITIREEPDEQGLISLRSLDRLGRQVVLNELEQAHISQIARSLAYWKGGRGNGRGQPRREGAEGADFGVGRPPCPANPGSP